MAYVAITTKQTGDPVTTDFGNRVKDNFADHESRLGSVESAINLFKPLTFSVFGDVFAHSPVDEIMVERVPFGITILGARLFVVDAGSSGTLTIDIEKSVNDGASWSTIFSTQPSVLSSDGNYFLSTNQVLSVTTAAAGDLLRLNVDSAQVGSEEWHALIEFEKS